ncbi:MAG: hypothetical protein NW223_03105 [Hyphomicrobiaceae bacterium]|nr:hypothetical protein [Hyphomicrobiaceae bacterium]
MARKPKFGMFNAPTRQAKPEEPPAPRRTEFEATLCEAIRRRLRAILKYEDDALEREFEPAAVYWSETGRVCASGVQVKNGNKPMEASRPHNFEVGLMRSVRLSDVSFVPDPRFDRNNPKYARGIICSV